MIEFISHLFDTDGFTARWQCGNWTDAQGWLLILSDLAIWAAYFAIPGILAFFVLRRRDIPFRKVFWLFGVFILACGLTHLMDALMFWWPAYRLAALTKLMTAVVSWGTVFALIRVTPRVLAMRGPEELERESRARREAENAMRQSNAELERHLEVLRISEEADRHKNEFLATLAHELRNPLAPIVTGLELIKLAKGDQRMIEEARALMARQVEHMVRLVDDLLDLGRISRGRVELRKKRVELAAVIQSALEASRPIIQAQSHELTVTLPKESIYLDADPTRLAQVISNLLHNAAKYTEKGGRIGLTAEAKEGQAIISIRDSGIGITAEHLPHIFEMFSQVAPALERSQGGLGVGLALARGLVELHGGTIEGHSRGLGMGSEFIVRLPIALAPLPQEQAGPADEVNTRPVGPHFRILLVDDNRDTANTMAELMTLMGHEVRAAYHGVEAVETAGSFRPEVVLMDIGLPGINGYEAARQIRQQPWGKSMVLIALTGWGQNDDKAKALASGFDYHLTKPITAKAIEELLARIYPRQHSP